MAEQLRSLTKDRELRPDQLYRDLRSPLEKFNEFTGENPGIAQTLCALLILPVFASPTFFCLVCLPLIWYISRSPLNYDQTLPLLLPREAGIPDKNDPVPGRRKNFKARGQFLIGNQRFAKRTWEVWLSFAHFLQHCMVLGTTGAGKTETLVSMVANYIASGSGVMYSDAKAAPKLAWQIFTLARFFGRDDDFRALNYIKGNTSVRPDPAERRSNTSSPFAVGSAESLIQLGVSLMPPGGNENKLFSERAIGLFSAVMPALVDLRDAGALLIDPGVIRKHLEYEEVEKLKKNPLIHPRSRESIRSYLASLPGYTENPPRGRQPEEVGRQFGFAQAYFTRALASLADTYGDIYMTGRGEINYVDVLLRRRIVVVMIPALEKAKDEMQNLGKIVLAAQKNAISTGIPPQIEGRREDIIESLPITAPVPMGIINDEFAFMMTSGYGACLAQARGLFVSITIAGQDYAGMAREDEGEAEQIAENTKVKIIMASEGLGKTAALIKEIAGEGVALQAAGYAMDQGSMAMSYIDNRNAAIEKKSRIDTTDLRGQIEGEGIVFWRDKIVPVNMFYHGLDEKNIIKNFVIHRMLSVDLPTRGYGAKILKMENRRWHDAIDEALLNSDEFDAIDMPPDLEFIKPAVAEFKQTGRSKAQQDCVAFIKMMDALTEKAGKREVASEAPNAKTKTILDELSDDDDLLAFLADDEATPTPNEVDTKLAAPAALDLDDSESGHTKPVSEAEIVQQINQLDSDNFLMDALRENPWVFHHQLIKSAREQITDIEAVMGTPPEEQEAIAASVVQSAEESVAYPNEPHPKLSEQDIPQREREMNEILEEWLQGEEGSL